jgi:uncharacterized membrane protein
MAWLAIALISGAVAGYQFFAEGWQSAAWMLFITGVSVGMYLVRRRQRIGMEDRS